MRAGAAGIAASLRSSLLVTLLGASLVTLLGASLLGGCASAPPAPRSPSPLPRAAYAHYLAGRAAAFDEKPASAVPHLRAAAAAAPDEPLLAVALINGLREAEDFPAARIESSRALARWPGSSEVWRAAGELHAAERAFGDAASAFRRAIELDPRDEEAHIGLVGALQEQGNLEAPATRTSIQAVVRHLLAELPESVAGHYLLAQLSLLAPVTPAQRSLALAELRTVLRLSPGHLDARALLAQELRLAGDLPAAIAEARSAFDRSGEDLDFAEPLLELLCEAGDRVAALDLLGLYDDAERAPAELARTARWSLELGELDLAGRLLRRALAAASLFEDPEDPAARSELTPLRLQLALSRLLRPLRPAVPSDTNHSRCGR